MSERRYLIKPASAAFVTIDAYGETSVTADEIIDSEAEPIDTGLVDQSGNTIYRRSERVKIGFHL